MRADQLAPLAFALPLATAALCAAIGSFVPRRLLDSLAIAASAAATATCALLTAATLQGTVVHWFGGWTPRHGIALGIAFTVDPISGAFATFAALLTTATLLYAWTYYDDSGPPFPVLMLAFLGALIGFFLTGDLFNLFVFFELMGVAAYALTSYRTEDESAVMGALGFAVVNSVGAFLMLLGITLVYGRTGALNMAQIAHGLSGHADALVLVAFAFIACGLLVKGALAPFHFWLADAHAVAPTPLCVLFSGIMVQAGIYAVARVTWSVFWSALAPYAGALTIIFLTLGLVTAFVGSLMAFTQRHFKRLLAFSTISHSGAMVCAFALLSAHGMAGLAVYVIGHGLSKAALFMCSGILLNRMASVDVEELRGRLRTQPWLVGAIALGGLALAGFPPFGTFAGDALLDNAAKARGLAWLTLVLIVPATVTGAGVLNGLGRMAFGWGPPPDPHGKSPKREEPETSDRGFPVMMYAVAALLILCACGVGVVGNMLQVAIAAGERFVDVQQQSAVVLHGLSNGPLRNPPPPEIMSGIVRGTISGLLAIAVAAIALFAHRLGAAAKTVGRLFGPPLAALRGIHSGVVPDEIAWLAAGAAAITLAIVGSIR